MDTRQLRYLVAVVHQRSISRAAEALSMTQPPLSTSIAQLERELGVRLLERHPRGVEPTEAGQYLVDRAVALLADLADAETAVRAVGTGRLGRLTVAASPATAIGLLPALMRTFGASSPGVETDIRDAAEPDVLAQVRDRVSDVGLVYTSRTAELERLVARDLEVALVHREPLHAVAPPGLGVVAGRPTDLAGLGGERWVLPTGWDGYPGLAECVRDAWLRAGIAPSSHQTCSSVPTAMRLVEAGLGVTLLPASVAWAAGPSLVSAPLIQPVPPVEAAVLWRRHERRSPVLARFLRAAMQTVEPDRLGPDRSRPAPEAAPVSPRTAPAPAGRS